MRGAIRLFKIFGIGINIHITFLLLPVIFSIFYGAKGAVLIFLIFFFVTMHELCHSIVASKFGIKVDNITLLPIGGLASMRRLPEKPSQEFAISISGPLFNLSVAGILFFPLYYMLGPKNLFSPGLGSWSRMFAYAFWINPMLAFFNLLPAFPMDGGRVVRAFLARRMDYRRATEIATGIGHLFAILFGMYGVLSSPPNLILIAIAIFIYMAASQEELQVNVRIILKKFYVEDILPQEFFTISFDARLSEVLDLVLHSHQEDFPVVKDGRLVGLLLRGDIIKALHSLGTDTLVKDTMRIRFPTLHPQDRLDVAHKKFEEWAIKAIPVVENKKVIGIINVEDISRVYMVMAPQKEINSGGII